MNKTYKDQIGKDIFLTSTPQRIVSLVPSQTELLYYLGLENEVVGITKFCIHPEQWFRNKTRVGGTKTVNTQKVIDLKPDLIIANKEENDKEQVLALAEQFPVWTSDILTLEDSYEMIKSIGEITATQQCAKTLVKELQEKFAVLKHLATPLKTAYFIWYNPLMVAAKNTFIDNILSVAGYQNAFSHLDRYPIISEKELAKSAPDVVFLSSEPFPFKEKHIKKIKKIYPNALVCLVDGELFSWYGSRLLHSYEYLQKLRKDISTSI